MISFILRRVAQAIVVMLGVTLIVFLMTSVLPGGPARALLGPRATAAQVHQFIIANGYNEPIFVQYLRFLSRLVRGDLGYSYSHNQSISSLLAFTLPKSMLLVALAYVVALLVGLPLGLLQAVKRNSRIDYAITVVSFGLYSMPQFWLGILLISLFSVHWGVFPASAPDANSVGGILSQWQGLVLPVLTLALVTLPIFLRFTRSQAVDVLVQNFIRTARAKGNSTTGVVKRHVVRNSLTPIISIVGFTFPRGLVGAIVVERIFNYPGMGLLFWNAASVRDYPVLVGGTLAIAFLIILGNLLADILYALVDPRIKYV